MNVTEWAAKVAEVTWTLRHLGSLVEGLAVVPTESPSPELVAQLLEIRSDLLPSPNDRLHRHAEVAADFGYAVEQSGRPVQDAMVRLLTGLDAQILRALAVLTPVPSGLILTSDFGAVSWLIEDHGQESPVPVAVGHVASLPEGHPLRSVLPVDEFFRTADGPGLVLGAGERAHGHSYRAQPWYMLRGSLNFTARQRKAQRQSELEYQEQEETRQQVLKAVWEASTAGRLAALEKKSLRSE